MKNLISKTYKIEDLTKCEGMIKDIIFLYEVEKRTLNYIAVKFNIATGTVRQVLIDNNIKLRTKNAKGNHNDD